MIYYDVLEWNISNTMNQLSFEIDSYALSLFMGLKFGIQ